MVEYTFRLSVFCAQIAWLVYRNLASNGYPSCSVLQKEAESCSASQPANIVRR